MRGAPEQIPSEYGPSSLRPACGIGPTGRVRRSCTCPRAARGRTATSSRHQPLPLRSRSSRAATLPNLYLHSRWYRNSRLAIPPRDARLRALLGAEGRLQVHRPLAAGLQPLPAAQLVGVRLPAEFATRWPPPVPGPTSAVPLKAPPLRKASGVPSTHPRSLKAAGKWIRGMSLMLRRSVVTSFDFLYQAL